MPAHESGGGGDCTKVAETAVSAAKATSQGPLPRHAPSQLSKRKFASGVAVSEMSEPSSNAAAQVAPQSTPEGLDRTMPEPFFETKRLCLPVGGGGTTAKVAVTCASLEAVNAQEPVPEQAPDQPEKTAPWSAAAVSAIAAPSVAEKLQLPRHPERPAPLTLPGPVEFTEMVRETGPMLPEPASGAAPWEVSTELHPTSIAIGQILNTRIPPLSRSR